MQVTGTDAVSGSATCDARDVACSGVGGGCARAHNTALDDFIGMCRLLAGTSATYLAE